MFTLYVMVFLIVNGVRSEEPSAMLESQVTFPTEQKCTGYFDTPEGAEVKRNLLQGIAAGVPHGQPFAVGYACGQKSDEKPGEDNKI
jgi:hypothetical protein